MASLLDADKAADRLAYFYIYPAKVNLFDIIEEYPGLSSWQEFLDSAPSVAASARAYLRYFGLGKGPS